MRPLFIFEGEEAHASHCSASGHVLCPPREMRIRPGRQDQNLESSGPNFYGAAFEQNRKAQKGGRRSNDIPESGGCLGPPGVRARQAEGRGGPPLTRAGAPLGPGPLVLSTASAHPPGAHTLRLLCHCRSGHRGLAIFLHS